MEGVKIKDGEEETVGSNKDVIQTLFNVAVKKRQINTIKLCKKMQPRLG